MEQKFRAFDKSTGPHGKMIYLAGFVKYGEGWTGGDPNFKFYELYYSTGGFYKTEASKIVIMQTIGLLDILQTPIFDADVLSWTGSDGKEFLKVVKWDPTKAAFQMANVYELQHEKHWDIWHGIDEEWLKKIQLKKKGNIYENQELLKP